MEWRSKGVTECWSGGHSNAATMATQDIQVVPSTPTLQCSNTPCCCAAVRRTPGCHFGSFGEGLPPLADPGSAGGFAEARANLARRRPDPAVPADCRSADRQGRAAVGADAVSGGPRRTTPFGLVPWLILGPSSPGSECLWFVQLFFHIVIATRSCSW